MQIYIKYEKKPVVIASSLMLVVSSLTTGDMTIRENIIHKIDRFFIYKKEKGKARRKTDIKEKSIKDDFFFFFDMRLF